MIVAGQAVNAWAKLFLPWDKNHNKSIKPNLQDLLPFTSKDLEVMDVLSSEIEAVGPIEHKVINDPFHRVAPAEASTWHIYNANGELFQVQVMNWLEGTNLANLRKNTVRASFGEGTNLALPDPIALLPGKVANLIKFRQDSRQDLRHCQMLACCSLAFLGTQCENPDIPVRKILSDLERLHLFSKTPQAKEIRTKYNLLWEDCYPLEQIKKRALQEPKLQNWLDHQEHRKLNNTSDIPEPKPGKETTLTSKAPVTKKKKAGNADETEDGTSL